MAKAKFPGRPSKIHSRKRVLSSDLINCRDFDGFRAAEDAYCRLSVFDFLFPEENEGSLFHGFSPHDIQDAKVKLAGYVKERDSALSTASLKVERLESKKGVKSRKSVDSGSKEVKRVNAGTSAHSPEPKEPRKPAGGKPPVSGNPAVSGKFVLPSRSAHSSRVIKPNKRFLENLSPDRTNKKARLDNEHDVEKENSVTSEVAVGGSSTSAQPIGSPSQNKTSSPVKFVLQKPKLKITSEPYSMVEGPFSSQSSPPLERVKGQKKPPTKVICGVCGSMWYYKHVKQARKYGIFSCGPCNKFVMRTLKAHENKSIGVYACASSTGNCVIRHSTLGSCIPFSTEKQPYNAGSTSRCQACWLNLCLRSYHLPSEVVKRLSKYLPPEIQDRPVVESESKKPGLRSSSDVSYLKEEQKDGTVSPTKTSKGKIKLPLAGPRVKHVCRSASLVLGQPVAATFDDKGSDDVEDVEVPLDSAEGNDRPSDVTPGAGQGLPTHVPVNSDCRKYERPVARTLQDLGRDNCELLDGMEKHELEKKFAKVAIDFWEAYDPEEVTLSGFPLIGSNNLNVKALCFLCGSAGLEKLVHCSNCCEAYHTFCVSSLKSDVDKKDWWRLDWFCPKCTECSACSKPGGTQLLCASCHASYHSNCVSSGRANVIEGTWMCPSCLNCSSCHDLMVHVFVGNVPLCKQCFKLRKRGNFCPLCQVCYDDNDFDTKMMECADCKKWIHAKCEKISDETYQLLSYLPSSIEFVCRCCCKEPPPLWKRAVSAQLKVGLLNVIKALSKNKVVCNMLKASPTKKSCSCRNYLQKPIILKSLSGPADTAKPEGEQVEDKCPDLGLLTPNLTKDDEECMESAKIHLVNSKVIREDNPAVYEFREDADDLPITRFEQTNTLNLLSIVGWANDRGVRRSQKSPISVDAEIDKKCSCETEAPSPPSIMEIKKKIECNHYSTLEDFNRDMLEALEGVHHDSTVVYKNSLKPIFPWFDPENPSETSIIEDTLKDAIDLDTDHPSVTNKLSSNGRSTSEPKEVDCSWKDLLAHEPDYYYINSSSPDIRTCMFCKALGEGQPSKEGRLLYCGYNEWVHLNCALWSSEVFEEIDGSLQNVHSAISRARMIRCFWCEKKGASVGCCARSCPSAYHLACALQSNCIFLANKEVYCKIHSHMRGDNDLHDPKDFHVSRPIHVELDPKKRKEVLFSEVRMAIGSLLIHMIGEIIPEDSDYTDVIVPCDYECSRWFWSAVEPWKLVRYFIVTRVVAPCNDYCPENDINYTIDHSLEFTPPPSPIDTLSNVKCLNDERDIKNLLSQMVDIICTREEDSNLVDQQATDLLPPDIEEAIFEDLPHDILDGISMHDIFTKMNFEDFTECKIDKLDIDMELPSLPKKMGKDEKNCELYKIKSSAVQKPVRRYDCSKESDNGKWKSGHILQLDGAADIDSSDNESMDSSYVVQCSMYGGETSVRDDQPVKCDRCHRTYRSSIGYERHLPSCDTDFSCESDSSGDEDIQSAMKQDLGENVQFVQAEQIVNAQDGAEVVSTSDYSDYSQVDRGMLSSVDECQSSAEESVEEEEEEDNDDNSEAGSSCDIQTQRVEMVVDVYQDCHTSENGLTVEEVQDVQCSDVETVTSSPALIVQQIPQETLMPQYVTSYSQPSIQQQPELQYFNPPTPSSFHYQPAPMAQTVLPAVQPTVVGTIVQSGCDQIVFNQQNHLDLYSPPSNSIYITSPPMLVGMETVVSNTVMSSSQFIPGVPGMMASSYSATTTQVFQAAKPQIEMPQNYVVVNTQPVQPVINHPPSLPGLMPNSMQPNNPWNNFQMNIQEYKVGNVSSSIQTVTRKVIHEHKDVDGVKTINSTQETIFIEPVTHSDNLQQHYTCMTPVADDVMRQPIFEKNSLPEVKPLQPKVVELPRMPAFKKEKPQQAVAPVVIKKLPPPVIERFELAPKIVIEKKEIPKCNYVENKFNGACDQKCNDVPYYAVPKCNGTDIPKHYGAVEKTKKSSCDDNSCAGGSPKYISVEVASRPDDVPVKDCEKPGEVSDKILGQDGKLCAKTEMTDRNDAIVSEVWNGIKQKVKKVLSKKSKKEPKIMWQIRSEDGLTFATSDPDSAWQTIFEKVQEARKTRGLPVLSKNSYSGSDFLLKKGLGLGNNGVKFMLEQLPGASTLSKYRPMHHKKKLTALEVELSKKPRENYTGCARTEECQQCKHPYDMFSWLASRHRRPPKLSNCDNDVLNGNGRRATSLSLPMAMRFRHLKETSKVTVGVFRSDIHGRGLFALREIDAGEMVIEYAGEVIRSCLTDKREKYYTAKGIGCYMFRIDDNTVVDATMKGNAARFINHSCEPNCYSKVVDILGKKHILIFALAKISQGVELTYDYKFPLEEDKINCHCLSRKCRKYLN